MAETQFLSIGLYSYPPSDFWDAAIAAYPTTAIIIANVDSGPGSGYESNFGDQYATAAAAGILMLGYVSTGYGDTSEADVEAQIADWYSFYGASLGGIFFDEVLATSGNETYYTALVDYCHTNHAGSIVMLNPGDIPDEDYLSVPIGDIIQVEENTYANYLTDAADAPSWLFDYPSSQIAVTVNTCSTEADMANAIALSASAFNAKYVWVTQDNIYAAEPGYFDAEVALLQPGPTGDLTVTATQGGGDTNPGILLRVSVLDHAAVAGSPNAGTQSGAEAHSVSITTTEAGSIVYGSIVDGDDAVVPMNAGCTNIDNVVDATNTLCYATFYSGPTGTPGANDVGTDASFAGGVAALEVLASGGDIATDASSPAVVSSTTATEIETGSFTPPLGTLLVAFVSAGGMGGDVTTMTVADSYGLTWTAAAEANDAGQFYAGVWYALAPAVLEVTTSSLPGATKGTSYSQTVAASGGYTDYTWSITSGSLPAGLSLDASTGTISGTPTGTGTSDFTVHVQDAFGNTASQPLSVAVAGTGTEGVYTEFYTPLYSGGGTGPDGGTVVNVWGTGAAQVPGYPPLLPTAIPLNDGAYLISGDGVPTAGNWLFAICAWRQDAGVAGVLQYPSTVTIRDDAHNLWIPVTVVPPGTGIARMSVWMAPAFRVPQYVFASPTAYQAAMVFEIIEVQADCPWYSVVTVASAYTNQGTAVTCTVDPAAGLWSVGAFAYDYSGLEVSFSGEAWAAQPSVTVTGGPDHSGDMVLQPFTATSTGSAMPLNASVGAGTADWAEVLITVHGVTDAIAFPYQAQQQISNWPALITEMACGQVLNSNWSFDSGIAGWSAESATITASSLYTFGNSAGSMLITPNGEDDPGAEAGVVAVTAFSTYAATAWVTVPGGWAGGAQLSVNWYTAAMSPVSTSYSGTFAVTGSLQQLAFSAVAPATAAFAQLSANIVGAPDEGTTLTYAGYAAIAIPGALGAVPDDQLNWIDLSGRTFTKEPIRISRGIQYEQQSLEAGTLEIPLADNDGWLTPGNAQSPYYPYAGDDDVPIRVRAVWPNSVTPYSVLYSGFTDDVKIVLDEENLYQYLQVTAADVWSRLTAQMLTAAQQEILADIPANSTGAFWPCNDAAGANAAANLAPTPAPSLAVQVSKSGSSGLTGAFGSTAISLLGDPGGTGWSLSGLASGDEDKGISLTLLPPGPASLPDIADGVSVGFWCYIAPVVDSIDWGGVLAACIAAKGTVWTLTVGNPGGPDGGDILFNVYDRASGDVTTTIVNGGDNWGTTSLFTVTFTQTTWAVYQNGASIGSGSANFAAVYSGFSFNGWNVPYAGLSGNCFNGTVQNIAVYPLTLPLTRIVSHYDVAATAELDEPDVSRLARVTGYGGFAPPLAMPGFGGTWPQPDVDPVTQITDTIGQVVSDYFTNIASSTLAMLAVDGTGAIVYRQRGQWYDRPIGVWYLGEHAPLALNVNPDFSIGVESWTATGADLTWFANGGQYYESGAAYLEASGASEVTLTPENQPATAGEFYQAVISVQAPDGYASGAFAEITWLDSSGSSLSSASGATIPLVAGAWTRLFVTAQAPAGTAFVSPSFYTYGSPSEGLVFVIDSVVTTDYPGEAPYLRDVRLSDDRAQMFNAAILTQSGTGELTTFSGSTLNFSPTSGITVSAENETSVAERGNVPYVATVYLQNTQQNIPQVAEFTDNPPGLAFVPAEGCIEDLASWIVQTLGVPVLRGDQVTLTPAATWQAMITALQAEIGDTAILARRPIGAPPLVLVNYISALSHEINIADEESPWVTTYQVSPAPTQQILQCDSPTNGCLTGTALIGW